jgi:beta-mannosidase
MRRKIALAILGLFLAIDALAWVASYRAATAPSPEELRLQAGATPTAVPSVVERRSDGMHSEISLNGEWRYRQTGSELADYFSPDLDTDDWHAMAVPQNWYLAGLNYHGVIWFRREFQAPADGSWRGRAVRLCFDGVDYFADVWLNGEPLGRHEGYFQPFNFDVTEHLNYAGRNLLAVRVESPYEEFGTVWHHHKTLVKGIFEHHDTRPGGGWGRAGQEYNTGGIWNDVTLLVSDYVTVDGLQLRTAWPDGIAEGADAALTAEAVLTNHADEAADVTVALTLTPRNFEGAETHTLTQAVTLRRGETTVELSGTIPSPRLWWPWDRGEPNLYAARLTVHDGAPSVLGPTLAEHETGFGFREVSVDEDWTWTFNGRRFFPRGSNYISTQWLSETDKEWFLRDVNLMREANLNFIRVHAHVEPVEFYEAADELGILVWQDFPLQWGYTDAPEFVDEALRQERDMIGLLHNHPSIAVWCAHNESPWDAPWMADRVPDYDPRQNKRLDELLRDLARELDPTRYVHLNSGTGDMHPYPGWYYGHWGDFVDLPGAPFVTEYGAQALPNLEMLQQMFAPEELTYQSGEVGRRWEFHDFQPRETFDNAGIEQGENIGQFIANSQAYQANLVQFATEAYRRAKYDPMQGIFHFMFVEDWPSITWAVVDYYRRPKAGYYTLQTAMQPILPSIAASRPARLDRTRWVYAAAADFEASLWVVNDTLDAYPQAQLRWRIEGEGEEPAKEGVASVDIPSDGVRWAAAWRDLDLASGTYRLRVELLDVQGRELGRNELAFAIELPPAEE